MKNDHHELARQTFVLASAVLESAHDIAIAGQSPQLQGATCAQYARQLNEHVQKLATLAAFLEILAGQD